MIQLAGVKSKIPILSFEILSLLSFLKIIVIIFVNAAQLLRHSRQLPLKFAGLIEFFFDEFLVLLLIIRHLTPLLHQIRILLESARDENIIIMHVLHFKVHSQQFLPHIILFLLQLIDLCFVVKFLLFNFSIFIIKIIDLICLLIQFNFPLFDFFDAFLIYLVDHGIQFFVKLLSFDYVILHLPLLEILDKLQPVLLILPVQLLLMILPLIFQNIVVFLVILQLHLLPLPLYFLLPPGHFLLKIVTKKFVVVAEALDFVVEVLVFIADFVKLTFKFIKIAAGCGHLR